MTRIFVGLLVLVLAISGPTRALGVCPCRAFLAGEAALAAAVGQTLPVPATSPATPTYKVAPPPAWVKPIDPDSVPLPDKTSDEDGLDHILVDDQLLVQPQAAFTHRTLRVTTDDSIAAASEIRAEFNPAYQTLTIHWLKVKRGGVWSDQLHNDSFQLSPRESDSDRQTLDGRYAAVCHLADVRVGDVVDYAYTVEGANPAFREEFVGSFPAGFRWPVRLFSTQLTVPAGHGLAYKGFGGVPDPAQTKLPDDSKILVWREEDLPACVIEPGTPPWYDAIPWVQLTEFKTWNDVADWASSSFSATGTLTPKLQQKVDDIKSSYNLTESRALAAIDYVQNDIRYFDIETGANFHAPAPPEEVMERGFGDAYDKAQLCAVLLNGLGIPTDLALVSTTRGEGIDNLLPSPLDFDHAILSFSVEERPYWIDATRTGQSGQLRDHAIDDFKRSLIISPETDALSSVTLSRATLPQLTVDETYSVPSATDPATLLVHTTFAGSAAESVRSDFASQSRDKLQRAYLDHYARAYPEISVAAPLRIQDYPDENRFELWESYTIPDLWTRSSNDSPYEAVFVPFAVTRLAGTPAPLPRKAPYRIPYPADVHESMEINLFDSWPLDAPKTRITMTNFDFTCSGEAQGDSLRFQYRYHSMAPDVVPADLATYNDASKRVSHQLERRLNYTPGVSPSSLAAVPLNRKMLQLVGTVVGVTAAICLGLCFIRRGGVFDPDYYEVAEFDGIGGWLIIVCFMIVLGLVSYGRSAFLDLSIMLDLAKWNLLTQPGNDRYDPNWERLLLFDGLSSVVFIVLLLFAVILMALKRFTFPYFMILILLLILTFNLIGFNLADKVVALLDHPAFAAGVIPLIIVVASTVIWIPYFLFSKRVKATFRS